MLRLNWDPLLLLVKIPKTIALWVDSFQLLCLYISILKNKQTIIHIVDSNNFYAYTHCLNISTFIAIYTYPKNFIQATILIRIVLLN